MAGYSTLKAARSHFAPLEEFLDTVKGGVKYPNVALIEDLEYASAKRLMLTDIRIQRNYNPNLASDTVLLDELADLQAEFFRQTLAYKQLELVFQKLDNGKDSLNRERWLMYADQYRHAVRSFGALTVEQITGGRRTYSARIGL